MATIISIAILVILLVIVIIYYNILVGYRNRISNAWSDIDIQLKRRYDLIPNLVETVKGYSVHEKETLENIAKYRSLGMSSGDLATRINAETLLSGALKSLFSVSENYPDLNASANFSELQNALLLIEDDLSHSRKYYNAVVRDNNTTIESFPAVLLAGLFGFKKACYFEIESGQRETVKINFN